jgi:hypothetical protein
MTSAITRGAGFRKGRFSTPTYCGRKAQIAGGWPPSALTAT